jgi:hypothetical protein
MFSISRRTKVSVFSFLLILSLVLMPGLTGRHSPATVTGSITLAQTSRTYDEFITGAYQGVGQVPTCFQRQAEYDELEYAASTGNLLGEARRFVSTLIETPDSFNDQSTTVYCQTSAYESRNPAYCDPFVNNRSDEFITDLYHTFLLRNPEPPGFNGWMSIIPTYGRKHVLNGFRDSQEFYNLVNALTPGDRPNCGCGFVHCRIGFTLDPDTCECVPSDCGPYQICPY